VERHTQESTLVERARPKKAERDDAIANIEKYGLVACGKINCPKNSRWSVTYIRPVSPPGAIVP
jgi:hypothetical protein